MFRPERVLGIAAVLVCAWCVATADSDDDAYSKVMGSVRVAAAQHIGNATTVNGSIDVGDSSIVKKVDTVNGSVTMHAHSVSESVQTVNGSVTLEDNRPGLRVVVTLSLLPASPTASELPPGRRRLLGAPEQPGVTPASVVRH